MFKHKKRTHTHMHIVMCMKSVGLSASGRGVSGNPLELVCEDLVNWRVGERGRRKDKCRQKKKKERPKKKHYRDFWLSKIVSSTSQPPHKKQKMHTYASSPLLQCVNLSGWTLEKSLT